MALWTDNHGLTLQATNSPDYLFLNVEAKVMPYLKPFMELKESQATFWQGKVEEKMLTGYLLPVKHLNVLNPFLEVFHQVLAQPKRLGHDYHAWMMNGLEFKHREEEKDRATIFWVSYQEFRLLMILSPDVTEREREILRQATSAEDKSFAESNMSGNDWPVEHSAFLDLEYRYLENRGEKIRRGDVVRQSHEQYRNSWLFISDGATFIDLDANIDDYGNLPPEFQCPAPFPIMYWQGVIEHNNIVWPNFEEFQALMEFLPEESLENVTPLKEIKEQSSAVIGDGHVAGLRWTYDKQTYYIVFVAQVPITYDDVIKAIAAETVYNAFGDDIIIADLQLPGPLP